VQLLIICSSLNSLGYSDAAGTAPKRCPDDAGTEPEDGKTGTFSGFGSSRALAASNEEPVEPRVLAKGGCFDPFCSCFSTRFSEITGNFWSFQPFGCLPYRLRRLQWLQLGRQLAPQIEFQSHFD
jgi:hypothetical protein